MRVFKASEWQRAAFKDVSPTLLLTGAAGGGKSRLAAEKIHAFLKYYPGTMGLMIRKTRESMTNSTVLFFEREIIGDDPSVIHVKSKRRFEYANGSILAYGGMNDEKQREQIRSIGQKGGLDICWVEEANKITEEDFNELKARMRSTMGSYRQIILTTNPDSKNHWINQRLILGGQATVKYSRPEENPANPGDYIDGLKQLTGIQRTRLWEGRWEQAEGLIYPDWDWFTHTVDRFPIPSSWRRFRVIDFGFTNPFVCQWWAMNPGGDLFMYREIYKTQTIVADLAIEINRLSADESIEFTVADWDAEDRATLARSGIATIAAKKEISVGLQAVQRRLRIDGSNGRTPAPRLFIMRDCLAHNPDESLVKAFKPFRTEDEFSSYVWLDNSYSGAANRKPKPEVPVDKDNHGMDALRYIVMAHDAGRFGVQVILPSQIYGRNPRAS